MKAEVEEWPDSDYNLSIFSLKPRRAHNKLPGVWYNTLNPILLFNAFASSLIKGKSLLLKRDIIMGVLKGIIHRPAQIHLWIYLYLSLDYVAQAVTALKPDYAVTHFLFKGTFVANKVATALDIPYHLRVHTNYSSLPPKTRMKVVQNATSISAISEHAAAYVEQNYGRSDISIIRQSLLPQAILGNFRQDSDGQIRLIAAGRFIEKKGFEELIKGMALLKTELIQSISLNIFGEGKLKSTYQKLISKYELESKVKLMDAVNHMQLMKEFSSSDLVIVPSKASNLDVDGIPTVIPEAMLLGIPVLATRVAGIPELIENGKTGFIIEACSPKEISRTIEQAILQKDKWLGISKEARLKVLNEYDINLSQRFAEIIKNG